MFDLTKKLKKVQSNLVNSKSSGLEVLFRIISSSSYREVDMNIYKPKNDYFSFFLSNISFGHVKETSLFTHPKQVIIGSN